MARTRLRLTKAIEQAVVAYIRAGGFPDVAAEAAGVPREVFQDWMSRGEKRSAPRMYREFAQAIRQAQAQARLGAEVEARTDCPVDWLRNGPGRETGEQPGWTATAKAKTKETSESSVLLDPTVQEFFRRLLEALSAHPEARAVAVGILTSLPGIEKAK